MNLLLDGTTGITFPAGGYRVYKWTAAGYSETWFNGCMVRGA